MKGPAAVAVMYLPVLNPSLEKLLEATVLKN